MARHHGPSEQAVDPLRKASFAFRQHAVGVELEVLEGVFAGAGVDAGTRHLLRWLAGSAFAGAATVLDVGCGYGPLGLWLAAADPARTVLAVDRDARALEATSLGVAANGVGDRVAVAGSLGYDDAGGRRFDLIVSNLPAKVGPAALAHLVLDARHHLAPDGLVAVVVVDRLAAAVARLLADPAVVVVATHPTKAYTAFVYRFGGDPAGSSAAGGFDRGVYRRDRRQFDAGGHAWEANVSWSIAEFDTLGHGTVAALELLGPGAGVVVVDGIGQGHLALALRASGHAGPFRLIDRDLLALRTAAANLGGGVEAHHAARPIPAHLAGAALAVLALPEKEPVAVTAALLGSALTGFSGEVALHGRSADVSRVLELLARHGVRVDVARRASRGAHAAVVGRVTTAR